MKWATVHKLIAALALLVIGWLVVIDLLLSQDNTGFKFSEGSSIEFFAKAIMVLFYVLSIVGFFTGYRYALAKKQNNRLFWISLSCIAVTWLVNLSFNIKYLKDLMEPPSWNIFEAVNLFDTSENRKMLIHQQKIAMLLLSILQLANLIILIRLKKLFKVR